MQLELAPMQGLVDDVMRDVLTRIGGIELDVHFAATAAGRSSPSMA
ncbi:hypothetical protein [Sinimarinibacterium thermocellulolyticum]|uniref:Uncharacterized protein n=1 Tax=Sinimarinibacterium thermocellulolyticum TaxID=3170016 RepID=A0ABV2AAN6_9GAMM